MDQKIDIDKLIFTPPPPEKTQFIKYNSCLVITLQSCLKCAIIFCAASVLCRIYAFESCNYLDSG